MIHLILDGSEGMDAIHDRIAEALRFPGYYGRNLDAMYDCLTEVAEDTEIELVNPDALGRRGRALEALLLDAAAVNPHIHL